MSSNKRSNRSRSTRTVDSDVPTVPSVTATPRQSDRDTPAKPERIGDMLLRERERRGYDLNRIADYLCIKQSFLAALENSQYELFPADAYVIGFLRSYATYLDIDGKDAIDRYRHEMAGRRKKPVLTMPNPITEGRAPSAIIIVGALVVSLGIYAAWYGISSSDRASVSHVSSSSMPTTVTPLPVTTVEPAHIETHTAPVVAVVQPTPPVTPPPATVAPVVQPAPSPVAERVPIGETPTTAAAATSAAATGATTTPAGPQLVIHAMQPSWVLVTEPGGKTLIDRILKAGEIYQVPNGKGLVLTTGNSTGILLTLDGVSLPHLPLPSDGSHVVRNISLDPARLKAMPNPAE